jgi:hypothetical protein
LHLDVFEQPEHQVFFSNLLDGHRNMERETLSNQNDIAGIREMLSSSGYAEEAFQYFLTKPNFGPLRGADHVTELTGPCGDTMKCFLKVDQGRIADAKYQVLGCPGAVSAAMALPYFLFTATAFLPVENPNRSA